MAPSGAAVRGPEPVMPVPEVADAVPIGGPPPAADLHPVELAGVLHELTALLLGADGIQDALDRLAVFTARVVPATLSCSVALVGERVPRTMAASEAAYQMLDDVQVRTGRGPGLDATRARTLITCQDLALDERWPEFAAQAVESGVRAVASVPLDVQRNSVGALTLFLPERDGIDSHLLIIAMAVAGQAEVLIHEIMRRSARAELDADLMASLRAGATVDHAIGVVVAQRGCGVEEAYEVLRETAQRLDLSPQVVAQRLVEAAARRAAEPVRGDQAG